MEKILYINESKIFGKFISDEILSENYEILTESEFFNNILDKFMQKPKIDRNTKDLLRKIVYMNDLDQNILFENRSKYLDTIIKFIRSFYDISLVFSIPVGLAYTVLLPGMSIVAVFSTIIGFVIGVFLNRLLRSFVDKLNHNEVISDSRTVIRELERLKKFNPKLSKEIDKQIERIEESIDKIDY